MGKNLISGLNIKYIKKNGTGEFIEELKEQPVVRKITEDESVLVRDRKAATTSNTGSVSPIWRSVRRRTDF